MQKKIFQFIALALILQLGLTGKALALSNEIKIDIATKQLVEFLEKGDGESILRATKKLRALGVEDVRLNFFDGQAFFDLEFYEDAKVSLETYVGATGREGEFYSDTIGMLASIESLIEASNSSMTSNERRNSHNDGDLFGDGGGESNSVVGSQLGIKPETTRANTTGLGLKMLECPQTVDGFRLIDKKVITNPLSDINTGITANVYTCFYGKNAQYMIMLTYPSGDEQSACGNSFHNPRLLANTEGISTIVKESLLKDVTIMPPEKQNYFGVHMSDIEGEDKINVIRVVAGSAAEDSGIKRGDKILSIGNNVGNAKNIVIALQAFKDAGAMVEVRIERRSKSLLENVRISKRETIGPRRLVMQNHANLARIYMEVPFDSGGERAFAVWINTARRILSLTEGKAIACN